MGAITVTPQGSGTGVAAVTVDVSLTVVPGEPQLNVTPQFLTASFVQGGSSAQQSLQLSNTGGSTLSYTVTAPASSGWLTISCNSSGPLAALSSQSVCVTLNPSGQAPGLYHAAVSVSGLSGVTCQLPGQTAQSTCVVNVTMQVSPSEPVTLLAPSALEFYANSGGPVPASQILTVFNTGTGNLNWTAKVHTVSQTPWLSLSSSADCSGAADTATGTSTSGVSGAMSMTVCVDQSQASPGVNYAAIDLTNSEEVNSLQSATVLLNVLAAGSPLPETALPTGVVLIATTGAPAPQPGSVTLANPNSAQISCSATTATVDGAAWLSVTAPSNSVPAQGTLPMTVQADATHLNPGTYYGTVGVGFGDGTTQGIDVIFLVSAPGENADTVPALEKNANPRGIAPTCPSQQLTAQIKNIPAGGFRVPVGATQQIYAEIACGSTQVTPSDNPVVILSIQDSQGHAFPIVQQPNSNLCPPMIYGPVPTNVAMATGQPNLWQCSWDPTVNEEGTVQLEVTASVGADHQVPSATDILTGTVTAPAANVGTNLGTPAPEPTAVANAASPYADGIEQTNQIALGSYMTIYGYFLSDAPSTPSDAVPPYNPAQGGYPTTYLGTTVTLGGVALPLVFVTPIQVNALVPAAALQLYLTAPAQPLTVTRDNTVSLQTPQVSLTSVQPGIFQVPTTQYPMQGAVLNNATGTLAAPAGVTSNSAPAAVGSYIQIYCNGLGPVTNPPADGQQALQNPLSRTVTMPQVFIGGQSASVIFSGLAPGFVSLYQINVQVPNVASGDEVPVYVQLGTSSNTVTIAVQ
jgi:uncharacterized protein (TIGR03437 family)